MRAASNHIAVSDHSPAPPVRRNTGPAIPGGHGMRIVERLTSTWGTEADGEGKTVRADLPTTGEGCPRPHTPGPTF